MSVQPQLSDKHIEVDTLRQQVNIVQSQLHARQTEVDRLTQQVSNGQKELNTLRRHLHDATQQTRPGERQEEHEQVPAHPLRVIHMASKRTRSATSQQEERVLEAQIRTLLKTSPGLSGRAIAAKVQCSPTTANKWKSINEKEVHLVAEQTGQ